MDKESGGDECREGGEGTDMAGPVDESVADDGTRGIAGELGSGNDPREDGLDLRDRQADADHVPT